MRIALKNNHAGLELKRDLATFLVQEEHEEHDDMNELVMGGLVVGRRRSSPEVPAIAHWNAAHNDRRSSNT